VAVGVDGVQRVVEIMKSCRNLLSIATAIVNVLLKDYDKTTQCI
jgi:hypothetical protein